MVGWCDQRVRIVRLGDVVGNSSDKPARPNGWRSTTSVVCGKRVSNIRTDQRNAMYIPRTKLDAQKVNAWKSIFSTPNHAVPVFTPLFRFVLTSTHFVVDTQYLKRMDVYIYIYVQKELVKQSNGLLRSIILHRYSVVTNSNKKKLIYVAKKRTLHQSVSTVTKKKFLPIINSNIDLF